MIFMDSFGHYDWDSIGFKWDEFFTSADGVISFVSVDHALSGGKGLLFVGQLTSLKKKISVSRPLCLGFRCNTDNKIIVKFGYDNVTQVIFTIDHAGYGTRIEDVDGNITEKDFQTSDESNYFEFYLLGGQSGSAAIYKNGAVVSSASGNFFELSNGEDWFSVSVVDSAGTYISDLYADTSLNGVLAVKSFMPSQDVLTEWLSSGNPHYTQVNELPVNLNQNIVSSYGLKELLRYAAGSADIGVVRAISLTPLVIKDYRLGGDTGIGLSLLERRRGENYASAKIYPDNEIKYMQLIVTTLPSTGAPPSLDELSQIDLGLMAS